MFLFPFFFSRMITLRNGTNRQSFYVRRNYIFMDLMNTPSFANFAGYAICIIRSANNIIYHLGLSLSLSLSISVIKGESV